MRAALHLLRTDLLVQNSFFITASTALMGALGFAFWVLCAHLFEPEEVGLGSSLVAASPLLSYLGLCGFQAAFVFYIPTTSRGRDRDDLVSTGVNIVLLVSCAISLAYIAIVPTVAPQLEILRDSPVTAAVFVLCSAALAGNLLTDSFFIAYRAARYNLVVDGIVQSSLKLALPVVLVGLGAFGIYASTGLAAVAALALSLVLMRRKFAFGWRPVISRAVVRMTFSFAAGTYVASILNLIPLLVLPVVVLRSQGAAQAGFYYVAFQVTNLVNAVSYAISQSMYAEGSQPAADVRSLARRAGRLMAGVLVPVVLVLVFAAPLVVVPFGASYREAAGPLAVMAVGCLAVGLNVWSATLLRLTQAMTWLVASNLVFVVVTCGGAILVASAGIGWVAGAWLVGNAACAGVALIGWHGRVPRERSRPGFVVIARGPGAGPVGAVRGPVDL